MWLVFDVKDVFDTVLAADDFLTFKALMIQTNIKLELEVCVCVCMCVW